MKADNLPKPEKGAIALHSFGGHAVTVVDLPPGALDLLLWGVVQTGEWGSLDHLAWAYAAEAGYQLPRLAWTPWLRAGCDRASGDDDPTDRRHETFFQLLPTARLYAQFPFYNMMNNQDTFAQLVLQPFRSLGVRSDFHWLRVVERKDFFYSGGGATKDDFFGFAGLPAPKKSGLPPPLDGHQVAYLADIAFTWKPIELLKFYAYYGHAFGGDVVRQLFAGREANYGYIESTVAF